MSRTLKIGYLLFTSSVFFVGIATGYFLRSQEESSDSPQAAMPAQGGRFEDPQVRAGGFPRRGSPRAGAALRSGAGRTPTEKPRVAVEGDQKPKPEDSFSEKHKNPFQGRPADELIATIREAAGSQDFDRFRLATEALENLTPDQVAEISQMLLEMENPKTMGFLARQLVREGGAEGLRAVLGLAQEEGRGIEFRAQAIEALAKIQPERRGEVTPLLTDILESGLPQKLEFHTANIYAHLLGPEAIPGLVDLLDAGTVRPEPLLNAMRDFARAEDLPQLTQLLEGAYNRKSQEILLRAIGKAAGAEGTQVLLDYLRNPPPGVRREAVGWALNEFAREENLPKLWEALGMEGDRHVQGALARAIAVAGGQEEIERLTQLAAAPGSRFSTEALAHALHDIGGKESVPLMVELLKTARGWEASEILAHGIARASGRQGIENLLQVVEQGGDHEQRRAVIQAIEEFGDSSFVDRLGALFERERDQGVSFHLAKAILRLDPARGPEAVASRLEEFSDSSQRAAIAQVLEKEGNVAFLPALDRILRSEKDGRAQWQMARTMASYGQDGLSALGEILSADPDPQRRASVLEGVFSVRPGGATELSRNLFFQDPSPEVRRVAAKILGNSQDASALQDLRNALATESDPEIRKIIETALRERGQP